VTQLLTTADLILRGRSFGAGATSTRAVLRRSGPVLLAMVVVFGLAYGAVMGTYAGPTGIRPAQMLFSATKVPLLLVVTFGLALPSFFVLNTLLGVREDFGQVLRALLETQAALTVVLSSLAPFTAVWYASVRDYEAAILFNAVMFGVASFAAQRLLWRHYRPLIARNRFHRRLLWLWFALYAFIGIQMGWVLRPFIGDPNAPVQFFRKGAWGNAYVELVQIVGRLFS
jgi:hypothetical protein